MVMRRPSCVRLFVYNASVLLQVAITALVMYFTIADGNALTQRCCADVCGHVGIAGRQQHLLNADE